MSATAWVKANKETVVWALKVAAAVAVAGLPSSAWATSSLASARARHRGRRHRRDRHGVQPDRGRHRRDPHAGRPDHRRDRGAGGTLLVVTGAGGEARRGSRRSSPSCVTGSARWSAASPTPSPLATSHRRRDPVAVAEGHLAAGRRGAQQGVAGREGVLRLHRVLHVVRRWPPEIVFHALEVAWIETTAFLSKTWTNFATGFQMIWEEASSWVAKRMLEIQGLFDDGLDVEAAKKAVDQQLESRLVELENAAQQSVTAARATRGSAATPPRCTRRRSPASARTSRTRRRPAGRTRRGRLAESQAALDAAKQKLAAAIEEARKKREAADAEKGTRSPAAGPAGRLRGPSVGPRRGHRQGHQRHRDVQSGGRLRSRHGRRRRRRTATPPSRPPATPSVCWMPAWTTDCGSPDPHPRKEFIARAGRGV